MKQPSAVHCTNYLRSVSASIITEVLSLLVWASGNQNYLAFTACVRERPDYQVILAPPYLLVRRIPLFPYKSLN